MSDKQSSDTFSTILFLPFLTLIMIFGFWYLKSKEILQFMFTVSSFAFPYFSKIPPVLLPDGAPELYAQIAMDLPHANPNDYGWETFKQLVNGWGMVSRLLLIPLFLYLGLVGMRLPVNYKYRRSLNMRQLADQNKEIFPSTSPALGKNLHKIDPFTGPWRIAEDYIDFAATRGLLMYKERELDAQDVSFRRKTISGKRKALKHHSFMTLNKAKTDQHFINQLGKPWRGIGALPPLIKALATALMACASGGGYRQKGRDLLDQISKSYVEGDSKNGYKHSADLKGVDELLGEVEHKDNIREILSSHEFEVTVLIALLVAARKKTGKIPPSSFLWLRPTDRTLWYSLHMIGGGKPWAEGSAAWAHYHCEVDLGLPIATPTIEGATDGLEHALHKEEWIYSKRIHDMEVEEDKKIMADLEKISKEINELKAQSGGK